MITLLIVNTMLAFCMFFIHTYLNYIHNTETDSEFMTHIMTMFIPPIGIIIAIIAIACITIAYVTKFGFFLESKLLKFFNSRKLEKK